MAITKKPSATKIDEAAVTAKISRGGSPARTDKADDPEVTPIVLRIPSDMLTKIDVLVKARPIRTSRHTWLMEAVYEKLQRENGI